MWPGFGENSRVLDWIVRRLSDNADAVDSPIGRLPAAGEIDFDGLDVSSETQAELFAIDTDSWLAEADLTEEYFANFDGRVPGVLVDELQALRGRLQA
jgi:phosphoenolpyruvate carboxykinase (GTP)